MRSLLEHLHNINKKQVYRTFDDVIASLPKEPGQGYPNYYELMQRGKFDMAAHLLRDDILTEITMDRLAFNKLELWLGGRKNFGWERNGWVLLRKEVLRDMGWRSVT